MTHQRKLVGYFFCGYAKYKSLQTHHTLLQKITLTPKPEGLECA